MDFKIVNTPAGGADMSWDAAGELANNVWLSLNIRRGSFFAAPDFGLRALPSKNTAGAADLIEIYVREALQWLVATGRAVSIEISTVRDTRRRPDRILISGTVESAAGRRVPFEQFVEVT
jgi:hypothetical protein